MLLEDSRVEHTYSNELETISNNSKDERFKESKCKKQHRKIRRLLYAKLYIHPERRNSEFSLPFRIKTGTKR
jgi:hypothetical protein